MIADSCQRFTRRRQGWRPAGEVIDTHQYFVEPIPDDTTAKRFVLEHHYEGTYPAARFRYGLFHSANRFFASNEKRKQHIRKNNDIPHRHQR